MGAESRNVWMYDGVELRVDQAASALPPNGGVRHTSTYFTYGPASDGRAVRENDNFVVDSQQVRVLLRCKSCES